MFLLRRNFIVVAFLVTWNLCDTKLFTMEAERSSWNLPKHWRSNASAYQAVWMHRDENVTYGFCLIRETEVTVKNVRFSNDGGPDLFNVTINGIFVGSSQSTNVSDEGRLWDVFTSSNTIGSKLVLETVLNAINLQVTSADDHGIEIDKFELNVLDEEVNEDIFFCTLPCIKYLPTVTAAKPDLNPGKAVQRSYTTQCAEEDNVHIAIFNTDVTEYEISASAPQYQSLNNHRSANTENCPFITPVYWLFEHATVSPTTGNLTSNTAQLSFSETSAPSPYYITQMIIAFTIGGRKSGYIDSEIGSELYLTILPQGTSTEVTVSYVHTSGNIINLPVVVFTVTKTSHIWNIPDFTWKEDLVNNIYLKVNSRVINQDMTLRMERRHMLPDTVSVLFKNDVVIVEGIRIDFWWQEPESMQLVLPGSGNTWDNMAYFRIYYKNNLTNGFDQIFVLYQDGNTRLLHPNPTPTAAGFDWIPFGTSVVIGQTNLDDFRPAASIIKAVIFPDDLHIVLTYKDNSIVAMNLARGIDSTTLHVTNVDLKKDTSTHPFATFRSMYVQAGNGDADSFVSDTSDTEPVIGGWSEVAGTTFLMYRRCESKHLTQSPDIKLTVTETNAHEQ